MKASTLTAWCGVAGLVAACSSSPPSAQPVDAGSDAQAPSDAGPRPDSSMESGVRDSGKGDGGRADGGDDATPAADSATAVDSSIGSDAGEAGDQDGGTVDAGPSPTFAEFDVPTAGSQPVGITSGPDGNLWERRAS